MDPFTLFALASSAVSAGAQVAGGVGANKSAKLNAENIKTQRIMNEAVAMQRANDRYDQFKFAESANRALLGGAMGRDIEADRSVAAFLRRNRETAFSDIDRIEDQKNMESLNLQLQGASELRRGREAMFSGVVGAFTTMAGALDSYDRVRFSAPTQRAPTVSPRPTLRPR
jgi:hypothetical protein